MTFILEAVKDNPVVLFSCDDGGTTMMDYSGYGNNGSLPSSTRRGVALTKGSEFSTILEHSVPLEYYDPVYRIGKEKTFFTFEAWVYIIPGGSSGRMAIVGKLGSFISGLWSEGSKIGFSTAFEDASEAAATYNFGIRQRMHLVGVHTPTKNSLYVNKELVAEVSFNEEQHSFGFDETIDDILYGGFQSDGGSQKLAINGIAVYPHALSAEDIARHYDAGANLKPASASSGGYVSTPVPVSLETTNNLVEFNWQSREDWNDGHFYDISVLKNMLVPTFVEGAPVGGHWIVNLPLSGHEDPIEGIILDWEAQDVSVSVSLDGESWTSATRGERMPLVEPGFIPSTSPILVKLEFSSFLVQETSFVKWFNATVVVSDNAEINGVLATFSEYNIGRQRNVTELRSDWGSESSSEPLLLNLSEPVNSIDIWIYLNSDEQPDIIATGNGAPVSYVRYYNGYESSDDLPESEWSLIHLVFDETVDESIEISGDFRIGHITLYDEALTGSEIEDIYRRYVGTNQLKIVDISRVGIWRTHSPVKIYAHDWSVLSFA